MNMRGSHGGQELGKDGMAEIRKQGRSTVHCYVSTVLAGYYRVHVVMGPTGRLKLQVES